MPHRPHCLDLPRTLLAAVALLLSCACTSTGERENIALNEARALFATAAENTDTLRYASSSMRDAEAHLRKAEELLREAGDQAAADHHAFMARQHLAIARARQRRGAAQQDIERYQERRQALMLAARQREATLAARREEAMEDELAETRMQLRLAEQRAKAMADRLVELGVTSSQQSE